MWLEAVQQDLEILNVVSWEQEVRYKKKWRTISEFKRPVSFLCILRCLETVEDNTRCDLIAALHIISHIFLIFRWIGEITRHFQVSWSGIHHGFVKSREVCNKITIIDETTRRKDNKFRRFWNLRFHCFENIQDKRYSYQKIKNK